MGPLVTSEHREKVKSYVDLGVKEGASLVWTAAASRWPSSRTVLPGGACSTGQAGDALSTRKRSSARALRGAGEELRGSARAARPRIRNGVAIFTRNGDVARNFTHKVNCGIGRHHFRSRCRSRSTASAAGTLDLRRHEPARSGSVRFYTRIKTVTSRWREGVNPGANFGMPLMK